MGTLPPTETPQNGKKAQVRIQAHIPEGMRLRVTVEATTSDSFYGESEAILNSGNSEVEQTIQATSTASRITLQKLLSRLARFKQVIAFFQRLGWEGSLLAAALLVYLATRLIDLPSFPIYFFTDEAVQTVLAADLVRDHFFSPEDEFLPTYFYNSYQYNLSVSVYLQVIPYLLFGKSIWVTRGTSALLTALGAACVGLTMRKVFKIPAAFSAILFLTITPAWFLHSRTAFETSLATSFFACFIFCYLMYRSSSPGWLYATVAAGALMFYSYSPARMVIGVTALLLFLIDLPYHWKQRKTVGLALLLTVLLSLPLIRFMVNHPLAMSQHLRQLSSYWVQPMPFSQKLAMYFHEYLKGLDPRYWYLPNEIDLPRHLMKGYGHVIWVTFPFAATGFLVALRRIRQSAYRTLLAALMAAPSGAALVALGITRALSMVIPLALLSSLGLGFLLEKAVQRWKLENRKPVLLALCFMLFSAASGWMLRDALVNGPLWYQDYGLGGMQYGARQIFEVIKEKRAQNPTQRIVFSPSWANGTDIVARFFFPDPLPFEVGSIDGYFYEHKPLDESVLFVMTPEEYQRVMESEKFTDVRVDEIYPYPNGEPGFYFVHLRYVDTIDEILQAEKEQRKILQERTLTVMGKNARVRYSYLDMGTIENVFDGSLDTLMRTMEANPLVVEIIPTASLSLQSLAVQVGGTPTRVTLNITTPGLDNPLTFSKEAPGNPTPRAVEFIFSEPLTVSSLHIEILSVYDQEPAHVHLWEIILK